MLPMKRPMIGLFAAAMLMPLAACLGDDDSPRGYGPPPPSGYDDRGGYERSGPSAGQHYDRDAPPRDYDAARDYRAEKAPDRALTRDDRVYRGGDGRYYCKRSDGTTGLVVGAVAGGVLGNILGGGGVLGTLLGAGGGAVLGNSVDRGEVRCR